MSRVRLYVNIDHVATVRQARRGVDPDPIAAATLCEDSGADGITAHLREDRRHIQDGDIHRLQETVRTVLNLEMACTDEMVDIALRVRPYQVTLVPERREEITTEGGLDVVAARERIAAAQERFREAGIRSSLFIAADERMVRCSAELGADAIELHTGPYAHADGGRSGLEALMRASSLGASLGLAIHAGHGLTVRNLPPVLEIPELEEVNIGHSIVSRAIFVGLPAAIQELRALIDRGQAR